MLLLLPVTETFFFESYFLGSLHVSSMDCLLQGGTVTCKNVLK